MMKMLLSTLFGSARTYIAVAVIAAIVSIVWYAVDSLHFAPIRDAESRAERLEKEIDIKDKVLAEAGKTISRLGQEIYDLNQSMQDTMTDAEIRLIECRNDAKRKAAHEKVDFSDEFFYTKLPF